jgi:hypothetical protein
MIRRALLLTIPLAGMWYMARKDIVRYAKIKAMSVGNGHPEYVPAAGAHRYPSP